MIQLKSFSIAGLFGRLTYTISFPLPGDRASTPSLVILHGRNGIGKTTILRMLDGLFRLDFNIFRRVPLDTCQIEFDSGDPIIVKQIRKAALLQHLEVSYSNLRVCLHPEHSGGLTEADNPNVQEFRKSFIERTEGLTFEFIDTERLQQLRPQVEGLQDTSQTLRMPDGTMVITRTLPVTTPPPNPKARYAQPVHSLAERVRRFIREAQVNYRTFFSTTEPDLFPRIIERLTSAQQPNYEISNLRERFHRIHLQDGQNERLGLEPDRWDYVQLTAQLDDLLRKDGVQRQQALIVLGSYVELLESRAAERALVADRLRTFERHMSEFFGDKTVSIDPREGICIRTESGDTLAEHQLSSGEFHFLFLMVAALVTRQRGTVIAIDEPEMSMHIAWQRKLIEALVDCASNAHPLFIFATHSPDLAASYPDAMIELK